MTPQVRHLRRWLRVQALGRRGDYVVLELLEEIDRQYHLGERLDVLLEQYAGRSVSGSAGLPLYLAKDGLITVARKVPDPDEEF